MQEKVEFKQTFEKATELLGRRMHTTEELRKKLLRRKSDPKSVEEVLEKLKQLKFLDDEAVGRIYLENLIQYKTWGYYGLLRKLLLKGFDKSYCEKILDELLDTETETAIARKALGKRAKQKTADLRKLALALQRKGFRNAVIRRMLEGSSD